MTRKEGGDRRRLPKDGHCGHGATTAENSVVLACGPAATDAAEIMPNAPQLTGGVLGRASMRWSGCRCRADQRIPHGLWGRIPLLPPCKN